MKRLAPLILTTVLLISCSNDRDDSFDTALEGTWVLTDVYCFCFFGENPDFSGHSITFTANDLEVENAGEFEFLTNVSGNFTLEGNRITLINSAQYTYEIEGTLLRLTFVDDPGIADDEVTMVYVRG